MEPELKLKHHEWTGLRDEYSVTWGPCLLVDQGRGGEGEAEGGDGGLVRDAADYLARGCVPDVEPALE